MKESAMKERPETFLSVSMGPAKGTDDTQRLICTFSYGKMVPQKDNNEGYQWILVKEL
jgi:hypothetical protein